MNKRIEKYLELLKARSHDTRITNLKSHKVQQSTAKLGQPFDDTKYEENVWGNSKQRLLYIATLSNQSSDTSQSQYDQQAEMIL